MDFVVQLSTCAILLLLFITILIVVIIHIINITVKPIHLKVLNFNCFNILNSKARLVAVVKDC